MNITSKTSAQVSLSPFLKLKVSPHHSLIPTPILVTIHHGASSMEQEGVTLVTGAAGGVGSVGFKIVGFLRAHGIPVRAMVHRLDERSKMLEKLGAEVVAGDLADVADVKRVMTGC